MNDGNGNYEGHMVAGHKKTGQKYLVFILDLREIIKAPQSGGYSNVRISIDKGSCSSNHYRGYAGLNQLKFLIEITATNFSH